jgi:hypothetical protein
MIHLKSAIGDRKRRQRGSILSSLLIIVAFLSILVGALMTELTSSFLISKTVVTRTQHEATDASAVELGIHQLQNRSVPPNCAKDRRSLSPLSLNGTSVAVTQICTAIVAEQTTPLATGAFNVDGVHDTSLGRNRYLVSGSAGVLRAYNFGQTTPSWSVQIGGAPTGTILPKVDSSGSPVLLVPAAIPGSGCAGHCVALFDEASGTPRLSCVMPSNVKVTTTPAFEASTGGLPIFPNYAFFSDSGAPGRLYVYDASADGACAQRTPSVALGGVAVGAPLVFQGASSGTRRNPAINDDIFVLVTSGGNSSLKHFRYSESTQDCGGDGDNCNGGPTVTLSQVGAFTLPGPVGGDATGYATSSTLAVPGTTVSLAVASASGRLVIVQIAVTRGPTYTVSAGATGGLPAGIANAPYWCHCPGQDLIGIGGINGALYLLSNRLVIQWSYDGQADGSPAVNSIPAADTNGDWYFEASDGWVYDVEIPMSGQQMFKAAKLGLGGAVGSSPIGSSPSVGACPAGPCLYFGSQTAGSYFVRIGVTRVSDLIAGVSSDLLSTSCVSNPCLWARVQVGPVGGGSRVYVRGWSYYSPAPSP